MKYIVVFADRHHHNHKKAAWLAVPACLSHKVGATNVRLARKYVLFSLADEKAQWLRRMGSQAFVKSL